MNARALSIASPCTEDWSKMTGRGSRRFCSKCQKHVTDLSALTRRQATRTLGAENALCVRYTCDVASGKIRFAPSRGERAWAVTRRAALAGLALLLAAPALAAADVAPIPDDSLLAELRAKLQSLLGTGPDEDEAAPASPEPPAEENTDTEEVLMGDVVAAP